MDNQTIQSVLQKSEEIFRERLNADFNRENIVFQTFNETDKVKVFESFCKKYFPYRLSDPYTDPQYFEFLASAFVGKENGGIDGLLIRTDVDYRPGELKHTILHELAHIYCVRHELDGEDFYDLYCDGTAPSVEEDGIINAGYAIWRECIAEIIASELDSAYRITSLRVKRGWFLELIKKIDRYNGKPAVSMILSLIMTSEEIDADCDWETVKRKIELMNLFDDSMFYDLFRIVFEQLRNRFCKIDYDFIHHIGYTYLNLLAVQELKMNPLFGGIQ